MNLRCSCSLVRYALLGIVVVVPDHHHREIDITVVAARNGRMLGDAPPSIAKDNTSQTRISGRRSNSSREDVGRPAM
jgi:hypothetical protein